MFRRSRLESESHRMTMSNLSRRAFLRSAAAAAATGTLTAPLQAGRKKVPVIDAHMHVWSDNQDPFPYAHPYNRDFTRPEHAATAEILIDDMDRHGVTHSILVQTIFHGWDNSYTSQCLKRFPARFRGHGLIDPVDPHVADKLDYWMTQHGFSGMRFSPIYYLGNRNGGDAWLTSQAHHRLWRRAEQLAAVFNMFISSSQLPRLEIMIERYPDARIVIDHMSQIDFGHKNAQHELNSLLRLATYPNVWVKISELSSTAPTKVYPFRDTLPWLRQIFNSFGPDRILWGTGYPGICRADYKRPALSAELALVREHFTFLNRENREKYMGVNAARLWDIDFSEDGI